MKTNMQREIKFRAWDGTRMHEWDSEAHLHTAEITGTPYPKLFYLPMSYLVGDSNDMEWMQYTGLKDKNGKEIYEGDIVEYQYLNTLEQEIKRSEVKLLPLGDVNRNLEAYYPFCYCIGGSYKEREREVVDVYLTPSNDCEVIGNIYENPELI